MGIGFTVAAGVWWLALLFCLLFIGIYWPVMSVEAEDMRHFFGGDFEEYQANVPLFIPRLSVWKATAGKFDSRLYLQYREYRAAIGALAAIGSLAAKAYFLG